MASATLPLPVAQFLAHCGGKLIRGREDKKIAGFASLAQATPSDICFYNNAHYRDELLATKAGAVVLLERNANLCEQVAVVITTAQPRLWYAQAINKFGKNFRKFTAGIAKTATVAKTAKLGKGVHVGAGAVIAAHVTIGAHSKVLANAVVTQGCRVGSNCILHEGCVIGAEGFGFYSEQQTSVRINHQGGVVLGDAVEIGANSCVDRGLVSDTVIGTGTKIDNQVQIGHNVSIGENCVICGQVGIGGSAKIGDEVVLGGKVGVPDHLEIASGVQVMGGTIVTSNLRAAGTYGGVLPIMNPAALRNFWKGLIKLRKAKHD